MNELVSFALMILLAGAAVTAAGGCAMWYMDDRRRMTRALRRVLGAEPEGLIFATLRGRAAGFSRKTGKIAVTWNAGAWCLVYRLDELDGAELIVDGVVCARVHRGEPRKPLDSINRDARQVSLRLVFDDPAHPDFEIVLWLATDVGRKGAAVPSLATQDANRWLSRAEAIVRRPAPAGGPAPEPAIARPTPAVEPTPSAAPHSAHEPPPWEEPDEDLDVDSQDEEPALLR